MRHCIYLQQIKLPREEWAKYVIVGKMGDFGKAKT